MIQLTTVFALDDRASWLVYFDILVVCGIVSFVCKKCAQAAEVIQYGNGNALNFGCMHVSAAWYN